MVVVLSMAVLFYPIMPVTARGEGPVTIGAVGDIMLARRVEKKIMTEGYSYPFDEMKPIMLTADIVIGNLETSLATSGEPLPGKGIWFRADPRLVESLCFAGFKALSLANNHILDYDSPALLETVQVLEKNGIRAFGAGENIRGYCKGQTEGRCSCGFPPLGGRKQQLANSRTAAAGKGYH
jgi:hypothetical protein